MQVLNQSTRSIPAHDLKPGDRFRLAGDSKGRFRVAFDGPRVGFRVSIPYFNRSGDLLNFQIASVESLVEILES